MLVTGSMKGWSVSGHFIDMRSLWMAISSASVWLFRFFRGFVVWAVDPLGGGCWVVRWPNHVETSGRGGTSLPCLESCTIR